MADPAEINVDALAQAIRILDPNHQRGAGSLAEGLLQTDVIRSLVEEVQRQRDQEFRYLSYGKHLVDALQDVTAMVKEWPDDEHAQAVKARLSAMWDNINSQYPNRPASLWNALSRAEQEEYKSIQYEGGDPARAREIEDLAAERVDGNS